MRKEKYISNGEYKEITDQETIDTIKDCIKFFRIKAEAMELELNNEKAYDGYILEKVWQMEYHIDRIKKCFNIED